jgi:glycerol-3-phosphate cytidylyltransferase
MDKKIALKNLIDLDKIFRDNKVPYWLQDGTLLGYYRDKDFISHDLDTDIGVMYDDFSIKILEDSKKMGFEYYFLGYPDSCFEITFIRDNIRTDLFFYYRSEDYIYHSAFIQNTRIDYRYKKFNLKESVFLGHKFLVPSDELEFILTKYGENWKIPDVNWNYAYSPKNHFKKEGEIDFSTQDNKINYWLNSKRAKKKKVITYGTFDTIHYGHIELLRKAKKFGDHLTVAVSSDGFNKSKGKKSFFNYGKRTEWINSIKYVDKIIKEKNWEQKILDIKNNNIDVLVMGDDWVGKFDYLDCLVIYLKRTDHISSTEIKKIIES